MQVGLAVHHFLDIAHRLDAGLDGGLELIVLDRLGAAFVDGGLDHFAHHRLAILLLEEGDRRFAGAEALEVDPAFHLLQPLGDKAVEFAGGDGHRVLAPQILGSGLGNLHGKVLVI